MLAVINFHRHSARHREASAHHFTFWVLRDELSVIDIFPCGSIARLLRSGTPAPFERECLKFVQPGALTEREKSPPLCPIMQADQKLSRGPWRQIMAVSCFVPHLPHLRGFPRLVHGHRAARLKVKCRWRRVLHYGMRMIGSRLLRRLAPAFPPS